MTLNPNQRKAMFAKLKSLQTQQSTLLRTTPSKDIRVGEVGFKEKESKLLKKSDKISNRLILKGNAKDGLKAIIINTQTQKMLINKAKSVSISKKKIVFAEAKGGF